jgi:glucosamine 6-phosphate synthetase-like amidotransferase/phosphosugar isomerase protein
LFFNAPQGPALQRMLDFLSFTHKVRVPSIVLTTEDNPDLRVLADHLVILPGDLEELFTPLVYIAPFYLFSYHMAEKRGFDPSARRFPGVVALQTRYRTSD